MISDSDIRKIVNNYDAGEFISKKLIYKAWNNIYKVKTTEGIYALKICNFCDYPKGINKELGILDKLKNKLPVNPPILTKAKKPFTVYNKKIILVYPFLDGAAASKNKPDLKNIEEIGKYLAVFHKTNMNLPEKHLFKEMTLFFNKLDKKTKEYNYGKSVLDYLKLRGFDKINFPRGPIHADLHTDNFMINKGNVSAILDFEDACEDCFIYDLALTGLDLCLRDLEIKEEKLIHFLKGYGLIRKLTQIEKDNLYLAFIFIFVYTLHFAIRANGRNNKKNLNYPEIKDMIKYLKKQGVLR